MLTQSNLDLAEQIRRLEIDRERHADAMAEIDRVLSRIQEALDQTAGLASAGEVDSGGWDTNTYKLEPHAHRRHGRFDQTGVQSVLNFIKDHFNPSTAEINAHWRGEGRKGTVNVTLLKLLNQGLITRQKDDSVRGSRYCLTTAEALAKN